jgi:hypothetical protein|tara:strand:+ start:668 stop:1252 length:585 start_codon:yes stop_codon:yes gene_type:complete
MPDIANTPVKICSRASLLIGGEAIQSFDDGTAEATICNAMYEDMARSALTNSRWRFASDQAVLNQLADLPTGRWDIAHQLPSESIMLIAVTINDVNIQFNTYGTKVFSNSSVSDVLVADYVFRANEVNWPPYFVTAVQYMMAGVLAVSAARDSQLASLMEQKANYQMTQARRLHSQTQTTQKLNTSRFIAERRS